MQGSWSVGRLASACRRSPSTASAALVELADLGWIRESIERHAGGEFLGFRYRLQRPPNILSTTAQRR